MPFNASSQMPFNQVQPILYADDGYLSHQVRLVLLEKGIAFQELNIREDEDNFENLMDLNPYNTLPVLLHRELVLYKNAVIFEYLEERYHQYKLLPETPIERATYRQLLWRINHDWLSLADTLLTHPDTLNTQQATLARKRLSESLVTIAPLFAHKPFFMSDKMGLCDCVIATMLWRLPIMQIELPKQLVRPLINYQERLFSRSAFKKSIL